MHGLPISSVINFVLLIGLLVFFLRKPLGASLSKRHDDVKKAVDEAEALRVSVELMVKEYQTKLAGLDKDVALILEEARRAGEAEKKKILERAQKMAERIQADARRSIDAELARARQTLEQEVVGQAAMQAAELLKTRITELDHKAFVQELVTRLEGGNGQRA